MENQEDQDLLNPAAKAALPPIGPGSIAGPRWFVSSKHPHLNITIRPALGKTDTDRAVPGVYAVFKATNKPDQFMGDGKLGTHNTSQTDRNDTPFWGVYDIVEPGPEPEAGYTDAAIEYIDDRGAKRTIKMKAAKKRENRGIIDVLRGTIFYQRSQQTNKVNRFSQMVELDWDPIPLSGSARGLVARGISSLDKSSAATKAAVSAPAETHSAAPAARVPSLGRGGRD